MLDIKNDIKAKRLTSTSSHVSTLLYIIPFDGIFPLPTMVVGTWRTATDASDTYGWNPDGTWHMSVLRTPPTPHAMYFLRPYRRRRMQKSRPPSSSRIATTVPPITTPTRRSSSGRDVVDDISSSSDSRSVLESSSTPGSVSASSTDVKTHFCAEFSLMF